MRQRNRAESSWMICRGPKTQGSFNVVNRMRGQTFDINWSRYIKKENNHL